MADFRLDADHLAGSARGRLLLEANAGTGKTYSIAGLVARLVLDGLPIERLAVMTFTRAATAELRERIRARLHAVLAAVRGEGADDDFLGWVARTYGGSRRAVDRLLLALADLDRATVVTIHGFCHQLLRGHALGASVALAAEPDLDAEAWRERTVRDWLRAEVLDLDPAGVGATVARLTPARLAGWARLLEQHLDLELVGPPPLAPAEVAPRLAELTAIWEEVRDQLLEEFSAAPTLRHNGKYQKRHLIKRFAKIDAMLAGDVFDADRFEVFAPDLLTANAKKGNEEAAATLAGDPRVLAAQEVGENLASIEPAMRHHFLARYREHLHQRHRHELHLDFNDLILALDAALAGPGGEALAAAIGADYDAVLVDEFQDTDPVQYRILERIFGGDAHRLFMIGDPKQAIYRFRGADVYAYLAAVRRTETRESLRTSYRSDGPLVAALNHLFAGPDPFAEPAIVHRDTAAVHPGRIDAPGLDPAPLQVWWTGPEDCGRSTETTAMLARAVAGEIVRLLDAPTTIADGQRERPLRPRDIAVLVGAHWEAAVVARALAAVGRRGIPCTRQARESVFAGQMATELAAVLAAVAAPGDLRRARTAAVTTLVGLPATALMDGGQADAAAAGRSGSGPPASAVTTVEPGLAPPGGPGMESFVLRLRELKEVWEERGFAGFWTGLTEGDPTRPHEEADPERTPRLAAARGPGGERRATDLSHLGDLLLTAAHEEQLGPEALVEWFHRRLGGREDGNEAEERLLRLDRDDEAVAILTVHVAKGLQFPVVFVPFAWRGKRPPAEALAHAGPAGHPRLRWDLGRRGAEDPTAVREDLADRLRLAYVAATRARHRCYLAWAAVPPPERGSHPGCTTSPLAWLLCHHATVPEGLEPDAAVARHLAEMKALCEDGDSLRACIEDRLEHAEITVVPTPMPVRAPHWSPPPTAGMPMPPPDAPLAASSAPPRRRRWPSSYSGLVRGRSDEAADHDPGTATAAPVEADALPRGMRFGTWLHTVLEEADFAWGRSPEPDPSLHSHIAAHARRANLPPALDAELTALVHRLLGATPPGLSMPLCALPADERIAELPLLLPVAEPADLAAVFSSHGCAVPGYAERLTAPPGLHLPPGFFDGVIDLVFHAEGRWHLLDWKSNDLTGRGGYDGESVTREMVRHHYVLQYHLYAAILQRFLRRRLPGYDYERHVGRVYYAFVRGIGSDPEAGWYTDRPDRTLIDALEACFHPGDHHA